MVPYAKVLVLLGAFPGVTSSLTQPEYMYTAADGGGSLSAEQCGDLAGAWVGNATARAEAVDQLEPSSASFFLHVPRTAGRVIHRCVLARGLEENCNYSYTLIRHNFSGPDGLNCGLFVSHMDHRIVDQSYEQGRPWVMTMLRHPVDRVLSSYEFGIEVAARRDYHKRLTSTWRIWPWNHLVPHFDADLNASGRVRRLEARNGSEENLLDNDYGVCKAGDSKEGCNAEEVLAERAHEDAAADAMDEKLNPYECSMFQPLKAFLETEVAADVLDNAATFQLLGLSELTPAYLADDFVERPMELTASPYVAAQLRRCTRDHGSKSEAGTKLMQYALHRLEQDIDLVLLHERLDDAVSVTAHALQELNPETKVLGKQFQQCVRKKTDGMKTRKKRGMANILWPDGSMLSLGTHQREKVPVSVVSSIQASNWMDEALHQRAVELFDERFKELEATGDFKKVKKSIVKEL